MVSALIQMNSSCARISDARKEFDEMPLAFVCSDYVVGWIAMTVGYVKVGDPDSAMDLLGRMLELKPMVSYLLIGHQ